MNKKFYLAYARHNRDSDNPPSLFQHYINAVDCVNDHFINYDLEIRDGKPYDPGNAGFDNDPKGFKCITNVKMIDGKVAKFTHCNGDGPVGWVEEIELED